MSELQDGDQVLPQYPDTRLVNAWRQVQQVQRTDRVAISGGRVANGVGFRADLLADWIYSVSARGARVCFSDDRSRFHRLGAYDLAQCDHVSVARFCFDRSNSVSACVCRELLFRHYLFTDQPIIGLSDMGCKLCRSVVRSFGRRRLALAGGRTLEAASRCRGYGVGGREDDVCRRGTARVAVDDIDDLFGRVFGRVDWDCARYAAEGQGFSDAVAVWDIFGDRVGGGFAIWGSDDYVVFG